MPRMTRWNVAEPIDVAPGKQAVYAAQGWVLAGRRQEPVARAAMVAGDPAVTPVREVPPTPTRGPVQEVGEKPKPKRTRKRAAKKSTDGLS